MNSETKKVKKLTSVLGLVLDGGRLEGVVLKRTNGSLSQLQSFSVALTLDPLTAAPELVGQEIRNQLEAAGVREKNCVVGLPLRWVLTTQTELPDLPDADAASLLQLETEKNFHADVTSLQIADSRSALAGGKKFVLLAGVPNAHVSALERVLAAAKLKPASFTLGLSALQTTAKTDGVLALVIGDNTVGLQITRSGVVALRALEGAVENTGGRRTLHANVIAREVRVTLGQLPVEVRDAVKRIRIFGPRDLARELADEMELKFEPMGLKTEVVAGYAPDEFGVTLPPEVSLSAAFSLAANMLVERRPTFEFLPPKPNVLQQLVKKYSSGKFGTIGAIGAGVAVIVLLLFLFQQIQLWHYRAQWSRISDQVGQLEKTQTNIRQFRPWYDGSFKHLTILRQLSLAFPEDGAVTAKNITIRDGGTVTCSGTARDNAALQAMETRLAALPGVSEVHHEQSRGSKPPIQFVFNFKFNGGATE